jgi:hypothetical protein
MRSDLVQWRSDADDESCCQQAFALRCAPTDCLLQRTFGSVNVCFHSGEVYFNSCSTVAGPTLHLFPTKTYYIHIQPLAAGVNTDAQLLSTVLNAHCTFHKHSFLRRVNIISVKRFLGHPVFIIECEGCCSRV